MRPTQDIGELIAEHMKKSGDVSDASPETDAILSGLRAAIFADAPGRKKILSDIAGVLGCRPEDLAFLFGGIEDPAPFKTEDVVVPNYREHLLAV
jgi:hypothetical protein